MQARTSPSSNAADDAVRREWQRRIEAEYRSAAVTAQLSQWLIQLGAPPALIRAGLRIVADELRHAELSQRVYRRAGGSDPPLLTRESLQLMRSRPELEADVTAVALQTFCLGETAAVRLFHRLRAQCSVPVARQALDRVLRDEVRHREFGWHLLRWLLTLPDAPARRVAIAGALPHLLTELRASYGGDASRDTHASAERYPRVHRAWGLMPPAEYRQAISLCIERDLRPRFARLEIR